MDVDFLPMSIPQPTVRGLNREFTVNAVLCIVGGATSGHLLLDKKSLFGIEE